MGGWGMMGWVGGGWVGDGDGDGGLWRIVGWGSGWEWERREE